MLTTYWVRCSPQVVRIRQGFPGGLGWAQFWQGRHGPWYVEFWHSLQAQRWDTFSGNDCKSGVSKSPGAMQFTRIPWLARSLIGKVGSCFKKELNEANLEDISYLAKGRVIPTMAPLLAEYAACPICPSKAATEAVLITTPLWSVISFKKSTNS